MKKPSHKNLVTQAKRLAKKRGLTLHPSLLAEYPLGTLFYCLHHDHGVPVEFLDEPLINRVLYVLEFKPAYELPVRFAAMRPVIGKFRDAFNKARDAYNKAWDAFNKARDAFNKARDAFAPALLALWKKDYPDHPKWSVKNGLKF